MSTSRRGRACNICHAIKIKCELGSSGGQPPCQRCLRLGKTCSVSAPMRQKDRIAELEARLEEVTKLMQLQQIQGAPPDMDADASDSQLPMVTGRLDTGSADLIAVGRISKKRRLSGSLEACHTGELVESSSDQGSRRLEIDHLVPIATQKKLLCKYRHEIEPTFPFPITKSYKTLREEYPLLLQALILAVSPGVLSPDVQDEVSWVVMKLFAPDEIIKAEKSIELVQALLVISFWYRTPRKQIHLGIDRFVILIVSIAEEIGISKSDCALSVTTTDSDARPGSSDAWRTWNLCFLLSNSLASCTRTPPKISWNTDLELKLSALEYGRDCLSTDGLLCQFVRAEKLCQQIIAEAGYNGVDSDTMLKVTDHLRMRRLQNLITDRRAQIFSFPTCPSLKLYEHTATILLHECILHTPTNNRSFAAPYVADRLSFTDFPAPVVTSDHIGSLYKLRDACHALLNAFMTLDVGTIASSPVVIFSGRAIYALWILVKIYVALTASGNTYGAFLDVESLDLETYLERIANLGETIYELDEASLPGRGLLASMRLGEWIRNCNALRAEESLMTLPSVVLTDLEFQNVALRSPDSTDWAVFEANANGFDYGLEELFNSFPE